MLHLTGAAEFAPLGDLRREVPKILVNTPAKRVDGEVVMSISRAPTSAVTPPESTTHGSVEIGSTTANGTTTRIGAALFLLGLIVLVISTQLHPARENPMDNPAIFREYAQSDLWIAVHLGQFVGFLLVIGGLVALYF